MKRKLGIIFTIFIILVVVTYFAVSLGNRQLTESSFPKKIAGYNLVNIKSGQQTAQASNVFLGIKEPIKQTFLANYKAPGAVVTLWTLVPSDTSKTVKIAKELADNMTKQGTMFGNFQSFSTSKGAPAVAFQGPMDGMTNYIYSKDEKIFWAIIVTKGNARQAFELFYSEI